VPLGTQKFNHYGESRILNIDSLEQYIISNTVLITTDCMVNWLWHVWQFLQIFIWAGLFFLGLNCATWYQKSSILVKLSLWSSCFSRLLALFGFWLVQFSSYYTMCVCVCAVGCVCVCVCVCVCGRTFFIFFKNFLIYIFVKLLN
jgi:hypothetical protein